MKHSETHRRRTVPVSALTLCSAALACSGYYPLGAANQEQLLDGDAVGSGASADTQVEAVLAPADFKIDAEDETVGPGSLAAVGDLDGDGYGDTAQTRSDFSSGTSMLVIRYGGPRPQNGIESLAFQDGAATLALEDGYATNMMTVFAAGDVDGDGYDDLLAQTAQCSTTQSGSGVYLVYGGPDRLAGTKSIASVAARFLAPERTLEGGGYVCGADSLSLGVGDLDADGIDDFVISVAPQNTLSATYNPDTGEGVYVFYGRTQRFSGDVALTQADARLAAPQIEPRVNAYRVGDVNGDGHADVLISPNYADPPTDAFLFFGGPRSSGELQLSDVATRLPGVGPQSADLMHGPGDLDGDGTDDLLLRDASNVPHLFYGAPGLFADGVDFARADATLEGGGIDLFFAGDRDGDGDDELLDFFNINPEPIVSPTDVALTSGSHERLSGIFTLPEAAVIAHDPLGPFTADNRHLLHAIPAGDLDGDGAQDLFTISEFRVILDDHTFSRSGQQIGIHYGTPGGIASVPR